MLNGTYVTAVLKTLLMNQTVTYRPISYWAALLLWRFDV